VENPTPRQDTTRQAGRLSCPVARPGDHVRHRHDDGQVTQQQRQSAARRAATRRAGVHRRQADRAEDQARRGQRDSPEQGAGVHRRQADRAGRVVPPPLAVDVEGKAKAASLPAHL